MRIRSSPSISPGQLPVVAAVDSAGLRGADTKADAKAAVVVASRAGAFGGRRADRAGSPGSEVESPFAAVSAAEALALALTPAQRTAIEKLTSGHTLVDSATAAGVNRTTLYRWLKHDPEFQAAFNAWQQDVMATARGRLLALTDTAVTAVGKAMLQGDGRLALKLLERMGIAEPPQPGATDVDELKREQTLERKKQEIARRQEEDRVILEEMMS